MKKKNSRIAGRACGAVEDGGIRKGKVMKGCLREAHG